MRRATRHIAVSGYLSLHVPPDSCQCLLRAHLGVVLDEGVKVVHPVHVVEQVPDRLSIQGLLSLATTMIRYGAWFLGYVQEGQVADIRVSVREGCAPGADPEGKPRRDPAGVHGIHRAARPWACRQVDGCGGRVDRRDPSSSGSGSAAAGEEAGGDQGRPGGLFLGRSGGPSASPR